MQIKKGMNCELEIENVTYGGKGFAKVDNFVVFIDNTVPGDIVDVKISKKRKNYAEARVIKFLKYSKKRILPLCHYSETCGGCKWQFLNYDDQLIFKRQHVCDAIEHISLIKDVQVNPTIPSDTIFAYRNKMEFSCSDRRWLLKNEMDSGIDACFGLGLHVPGTFYKVLDISECLLQPNTGNKILSDVREYIKLSSRAPYGLKSHKGFWRFLVIRNSKTYNQWMINIITAGDDAVSIQPLADLLNNKYENVVSVMNGITSSKSGVAIGDYIVNLAGKNIIRDRIGNYDFDISANSFFQTNSQSAKKLYDVVKKYATLSGNESILDLYCGAGTIPIYLSDSAEKVMGIEIVKSAINDAKSNCILNGIKNCDFILGDVKDKLLDVRITPNVLIIDPPRVGMHKEVLNKVLCMLPERLVYVSCNPSTLARDLFELKNSYEIEVIQPVDMFPHTFHIEVVARLKRKKKQIPFS